MGTLFVDNIKHQSSQGSGTITIGASGEIIKAASGSTNNLGIGMADQWMITGSPSLSADTDTFITADWARSVPSTFNYIGSGMSQSSGVFTFPSTGIYLVNFICIAQRSGSTRYFEGRINATTNNSSYTNVGQSTGHINQVSGGTLSNTNMLTFVDVTDTSNVKVKFSVIADEAITVTGNPSYPRTSAMFIRLGDT